MHSKGTGTLLMSLDSLSAELLSSAIGCISNLATSLQGQSTCDWELSAAWLTGLLIVGF
jgi:hypothetical protein